MGFKLCSIFKYCSMKGRILGSHISPQNRNYILHKENIIVAPFRVFVFYKTVYRSCKVKLLI